jgi:hypothetical protein
MRVTAVDQTYLAALLGRCYCPHDTQRSEVTHPGLHSKHVAELVVQPRLPNLIAQDSWKVFSEKSEDSDSSWPRQEEFWSFITEQSKGVGLEPNVAKSRSSHEL